MKTTPSWLSSAVIYQVNLRSLAAREPRNAIEAAAEKPLTESPLAYLTRHLPRLRRLGFNVLYLLPPYPIGHFARKGIGSPYASRDFAAVEPEYGTKAEILDLIRRAHALKLKVIFDITPNHTARDHVWMTEHPGYYVKAADGSAFFDCDWSDTAKLDYNNPALRTAMIEVYDHWFSVLGYDQHGSPDGIDGFRLDMAHFINDKSFWDQALPALRARHPHRELLFMAECYGFDNNTDLFARGMDAAYDDDFYKLCQYAYAVDDAGHTHLRLSEDAQHNHGFRAVLDAWQDGGLAAAAARVLMQYEDAAPRFAGPRYTARYTDNHDEGRGLYRFGPGGFRAMNTLAFLAPRTLPFLLTGEEFGALDRPSIHARCQPCDKGRRIVAADGRERRQEGVELEGNLFDRGLDARQHWYVFFKELVALRKKNRPLTDGACAILDVGEDAPARERTVVAFDRKLGRHLIRCAVNLGDQPRKLSRAPSLFVGEPLYGALDPDDTLPPFSAVVVKVS
jgi:glycosidase